MTESLFKVCMMCHKKLYKHVDKCGCGSHDFFPDEEEIIDSETKSDIYVLLPNGVKEYISKKIVHIFKPKINGFTVAGYPILQDKTI